MGILHRMMPMALIYLRVLITYSSIIMLSIIMNIVDDYKSTHHIDIDLKLVDDNEDNPDDEFGDNEVNAKQSRKFVSAREYYCFKLQVRRKLFNIILFGHRLFQQWAVDMYIKIETMRLDWYSKPENQKVIRADLYQVVFLCLF